MLFFQNSDIVNSLNDKLGWDGETNEKYDECEEPFCLNYDTVIELNEPDISLACKVLKKQLRHFSSLKLQTNKLWIKKSDAYGHCALSGEQYAGVLYLQKSDQKKRTVNYQL